MVSIIRVLSQIPGQEAPVAPQQQQANSLIKSLPANACLIWHPTVVPKLEQAEQILEHAAAKTSHQSVQLLDTGYQEQGAPPTQSNLDWYLGTPPPPSSSSSSGSGSGDALIPLLIEQLTRNGGTAEIGMFAMNSLQRPSIDLVAPFVSTQQVQGSSFGGDFPSIKSIMLRSVSEFWAFYSKVAASPSFANMKGQISFGFIMKSAGQQLSTTCHVLLILHERHHEAITEHFLAASSGKQQVPPTKERYTSCLGVLLDVQKMMLEKQRTKVPTLSLRVPEYLPKDRDGLHIMVTLAELCDDPKIAERFRIAAKSSGGDGRQDVVTATTSHKTNGGGVSGSPNTNRRLDLGGSNYDSATDSNNAYTTGSGGHTTDDDTNRGGGVKNKFGEKPTVASSMAHHVVPHQASAVPTSTSINASRAVYSNSQSLEDTLIYVTKEKEVCLKAHLDLRKDLETLTDNLGRLLTKHKEKRDSLRSVTEEWMALEDQKRTLRDRVGQVHALTRSLTTEIQEAKERLHQLAVEENRVVPMGSADKLLSTLRETHLSRVEEILAITNREVAHIHEQNKALLQQKNQDWQLKQKELGNRIKQLETNVTTTNEECVQSRSKVKTLEVEKESLSKRKLELQQKNEAEKEHYSTMKLRAQDCDGMFATIQQHQSDLHRAQLHNTSLQESNDSVKSHLAMLRQSESDRQRRRQTLETNIVQNDEQCKQFERLFVTVEEGTERSNITNHYHREFAFLKRAQQRDKTRVKDNNPTPCKTCASLLREVQVLTDQKGEANNEFDKQTEVMTILEHEMEQRTKAHDHELASLTQRMQGMVQRVQHAKEQHRTDVLDQQRELETMKETYDSLFTQLKAQVHEDTYVAVTKLKLQEEADKKAAGQEDGDSDDSPTRRERVGRRAVWGSPDNKEQHEQLEEDEVIDAYLRWLEALHTSRVAEDESSRLRQGVLGLQNAMEDATEQLANDRQLLGYLEEEIRRLHAEDKEAEALLEQQSAQQMSHRQNMEQTIEQTHQDGREQYKKAVQEANTVAAQLAVVDHTLKELRLEANDIAEELETASRPVDELNATLRRYRVENDDLAAALVRVREEYSRHIKSGGTKGGTSSSPSSHQYATATPSKASNKATPTASASPVAHHPLASPSFDGGDQQDIDGYVSVSMMSPSAAPPPSRHAATPNAVASTAEEDASMAAHVESILTSPPVNAL